MTSTFPNLSPEHAAFLADTIARNRVYAGLRMEHEAEAEAPVEGAETETEEQVAETEQPAEEAEPNPEDALPEWAREKLTKANAEAANYRVKLRAAQTEAQEAIAKAASLEEAQAAAATLQEQVANLERQVLISSVAQEHKLPADLASLLQGDDEAALKEHAKVLAKYAPKGGPKNPADLSGGLTPSGDDDFNAVATARAARDRRRR